jgi:hypothetical protein
MSDSPLSVPAAMHSADWRMVLLPAKLWNLIAASFPLFAGS